MSEVNLMQDRLWCCSVLYLYKGQLFPVLRFYLSLCAVQHTVPSLSLDIIIFPRRVFIIAVATIALIKIRCIC